MDELLQETANLWAATQGEELRLIGGLAVRLLIGPEARATRDIDVVALSERARDSLLAHLRTTGMRVASSGGWWRAVRSGRSPLIVDVAGHPIVNVRTFESMTLQGEARDIELCDTPVRVAAPDDIARLKLIAHRDQDLVDLILLARDGHCSAARIANAAELDDTERALSAGAVRFRHALESGEASDAFLELMGRTLTDREVETSRQLLEALRKEGA